MGVGLVQKGHDGIGCQIRAAAVVLRQPFQIRVLAVAGGTRLVAQVVQRVGQLVMAGHQLFEPVVTDIAEFERANCSRQPVRQLWRLLRGLERGLLGVEAFHHHAVHYFDDSLGAVDERMVVLLQGALQRLEGLLQHRRVVLMRAGLADAGHQSKVICSPH